MLRISEARASNGKRKFADHVETFLCIHLCELKSKHAIFSAILVMVVENWKSGLIPRMPLSEQVVLGMGIPVWYHRHGCLSPAASILVGSHVFCCVANLWSDGSTRENLIGDCKSTTFQVHQAVLVAVDTVDAN